MKKQNIAISVILAFALVMILPMISAASTLTSPVTGGNYTGTINLTCTTNLANPLNVSFYYNASGGVATYATKLATVVNTSAGQTVFTSPVQSISALTDGATYNFTCTAVNSSADMNSTGVALVTIDNTKPVVSISTDVPQISLKRPITLTWSDTDAISLYSTAVSLVSPDTNKCATLSYTTSTGTHLYQDDQTNCAGTWTATITGTDYAGNTKSASTTFDVTTPDGKFIGDKSLQPYSSSSNNSWILIVVVIIIIILLVRKK